MTEQNYEAQAALLNGDDPDDLVAAKIAKLEGITLSAANQKVAVVRGGGDLRDGPLPPQPPPFDPNAVTRPTGQEIFEEKTRAEQDEMLGPQTAALVREGKVRVEELKSTGGIEGEQGFITQKPVKDIATE